MRILTAVLAVAIASLAAPALSQTGLGANAMDAKFVPMAMHIDNMEVDGARAELAASDNASVQLYANTIIKDHTASSSQLAALAQSLNISYPDSHVQTSAEDSNGTPPPSSQMPPMASAQSPQTYFQNQVKGHQEAILLYQNEANNGGSPQLKRFAADMLPTLKAHLAMAQQYLQSGTISPEATPTPAGS